VNGNVRVIICLIIKYIVFLLELGSFTNLVMSVYILKIQLIKLAHTLEISCFLTCNNQFCFCLKESWKIHVRLWVRLYWTDVYIWHVILLNIFRFAMHNSIEVIKPIIEKIMRDCRVFICVSTVLIIIGTFIENTKVIVKINLPVCMAHLLVIKTLLGMYTTITLNKPWSS